MLHVHGYSLTAACKEAKVERSTAKKLLGKRLRVEEEVKVKYEKPKMLP